jgi:4-amino-4-deoxy-L-arabinose transferase-like glycosyltransferase
MSARYEAAGAGTLPAVQTGEAVPLQREAGIPLFWREALALAAALSLFTAALAPALKETGVPPGWDQSVHLRDSLVYERILRNPSLLSPGVLKAILKGSEDYPLITPSGYYPPLVPGVTALLYRIAGRSYECAMATNILFLGLLLAGTWRLGNRLLGSPAGVLAALLLLAAPGIRLHAGEYMLDLPLAALVVASAWALLATENFSRRGRSLLFGLLCGAGMLAKWSFFLFLGAPLLRVLLLGWKENTNGGVSRAARAANLALALLAALLVTAPYYAPILPILVRKTLVHAGGAADGFASPFTRESILFHLAALPRKLMGWPLLLSVAGGVLIFPWRHEPARRAGIFLGAWTLSLYLLFTFAVANKQSRYLLPWLPLLVLMGAGGIAGLWRERRGGAKAALALLLLALPLAGLSGSWRPEGSGDWQIAALADRLAEDLRERVPVREGAWKLGVIPDMREVNGPTVGYYVSRRDLPVATVQLVNRMKRHVKMEVGLDPFDRRDFYQSFDEFDYLVTKTGDNSVPPWEDVVPAMQRYFEERREQFTLLREFREPDGSILALYRRNRA